MHLTPSDPLYHCIHNFDAGVPFESTLFECSSPLQPSPRSPPLESPQLGPTPLQMRTELRAMAEHLAVAKGGESRPCPAGIYPLSP
eukprot:1093728-Prorocentrum_minimum.AAC.1